MSACASASAAASATVTVTEDDPSKRQKTGDDNADNVPSDVPSLDDLLVALDVAARDDSVETENTVLALVQTAVGIAL